MSDAFEERQAELRAQFTDPASDYYLPATPSRVALGSVDEMIESNSCASEFFDRVRARAQVACAESTWKFAHSPHEPQAPLRPSRPNT